MNKLMLFPLIVLSIITVLSFISGGNLVGSFTVDDPSATATINGTDSSYSAPNGGIFNFNLFSGMGLLVTIVALSAVGIVAGIQLFGSGLSEFSQNMIVKSVGFIGLFIALMVFSSSVIMNGTGIYGILVNFGLTLMYGIGFIFDVSGSGG